MILTRWRSYKIAVNCDITKMYRSVWLPHDQRDWLRLLWHPELDKEPLHFRMTRLAFGVKPCGSMAVFCLQRLAKEHPELIEASAAALKNFNVDDGLVGANTVPEVPGKN